MLGESQVLRIGEWRVDPELDELSRDGQTIRIEPRTMQLLLYLAAHAGRVIDVQQLLDTVWSNVVVTHGSVYQAVAELRRILGDDREHPSYIENLPRRGYRLIAPVAPWNAANSVAPSDSTAAAPSPMSSPSATPSAPSVPARGYALRWIGGTLIVVALLAASGALVYYRGASKPAERTSSGTAPAAIHSLAVLPLQNLSGDEEQEYFADGMTDALTTDLAQIGSLSVISRTSAMQFKGSKENLPQIGRDLKVDAIVEGSVVRSENRVRITAQLIEVRSDHHLWAKSYERDLKDVLALQDEIASDIAEQIRIKLTPKERGLLMRVHAVDPEAHDDYLRGRYWANKADLWRTCTTRGGCVRQSEAWKALEYYQKAIAKDPSYALGYAGLADGFVVLIVSGGLSFNEASPKVTEAAMKALTLDPSLAEPHASLGFVKLFNDWDWSSGEAELKQAIALNPNLTRAHMWYSYYLVIAERLEEAVSEGERARDLDPFDYYVNEWLGQAYYHARRYDDALRQIRHTLDMFPNRGATLNWQIAETYEQKRMFAEAFAARQQALRINNDPNVTVLGEAFRRAGYRGWLLKAVEISEQSPHDLGALPQLAHMYAMLGDEPRAMTYLERAYEEHSGAILFLRTAPELDSIRSSPRFRDLVRRIGLPQPSSENN